MTCWRQHLLSIWHHTSMGHWGRRIYKVSREESALGAAVPRDEPAIPTLRPKICPPFSQITTFRGVEDRAALRRARQKQDESAHGWRAPRQSSDGFVLLVSDL